MGILGLMLPFWAFAQQLTYENSQVPVIHPRSAWETPDLRKIFDWYPGQKKDEGKQPPPPYSSVERIVIHHTGGNVKGKDKIKVIREIFKYHTLTRGWGDIGYHFIVAQDGTIYEGRYGGNGVRGAHVFYDKKCENYNSGTVGIAVLGDFTETKPPDVVYESLARLVAWIAVSNNLKIGQMEKETHVWTYPIKDDQEKEASQRCDFTKGGFNATFTGPVVLGHNDIEKDTTCPGSIDIGKVRAKAQDLVKSFQSYLYGMVTEDGKKQYWSLENGFRTKVPNKVGKKVIMVKRKQLTYFPRAERPDLPSGSLVKGERKDRIYIISQGKKRPVLTQDILKERGLAGKKVHSLPARELAYFPTGKPVLFPEGTLLKVNKAPEVFLIKGEKRHHITAPAVMSQLGLDPEKIKVVSREVLEAHPKGDPLLLKEGSLVKGPTPNVYKIEKQKRRLIPSMKLFKTLGFDWGNIITLDSLQLSFYKQGPPMLYPDGNFLRDRLTDKVFYIKNGYKNWVKNKHVFKQLGGRWGKVKHLSHDYLSYYPEGVTLAAKNDLEKVSNLPPAGVKVSEAETKQEPSQGKQEPRHQPSIKKEDLQQQKIRVGLKRIPPGKVVKITADSSYNVYKQDLFVAKKSPHTVFKVKAGFGTDWKFAAYGNNPVFEILTYKDHPAWKPSLNDNKFQGAIEVKCPDKDNCWIINTLPVEDYLMGVAEALNSDSLEFLKAVAVAARSYALHYIIQEKKYPHLGFDLTNKASDQLYKGYGYHKRAPRVAKAVRETEGEILTYQGNIAIPAYCSDTGGVSKDACKVWGGKYCRKEFAYLRGGVEDPEGTSHNQAKIKASHQVGMSNAGARKMAELGASYREILEHYFPGTEIYDYSSRP